VEATTGDLLPLMVTMGISLAEGRANPDGERARLALINPMAPIPPKAPR